MTTFTATIPGDPVPQGRGRVGRWKSKGTAEKVSC